MSFLHRIVRNYLWYWVVILGLSVGIALLSGAPFGPVILGAVFLTFMLGVGIAFTLLWLDLRRRARGG